MFLRALARDLYKSQKEVVSLEQQLQEADTVQKKEQLKEQQQQQVQEGQCYPENKET